MLIYTYLLFFSCNSISAHVPQIPDFKPMKVFFHGF